MSRATTDIRDYDAIAGVLQKYIDGAKSGKGDDMKPAFHENATVFGYVGVDLFGGPIQTLFDWNDKNGAAKELQPRIVSIDLIGSVATVRAELDNWTGHRFTSGGRTIRSSSSRVQIPTSATCQTRNCISSILGTSRWSHMVRRSPTSSTTFLAAASWCRTAHADFGHSEY